MNNIDILKELEFSRDLLEEKIGELEPAWRSAYSHLKYAAKKFLEEDEKCDKITERIQEIEDKINNLRGMGNENC